MVVGKGQEIYDGENEKDEEAPSLDNMLDLCDDLVNPFPIGYSKFPKSKLSFCVWILNNWAIRFAWFVIGFQFLH